MDNFTFYSPTYFVFGRDTEKETGRYVKRFGGTKVLIHYGGGSAVRSGLIDRIKASLDAAGVAHVELGGVKPNPRSGLVYKGIELCKKEGVDFVLAVGGGSVIDSSKGICIGACYDGDFWDFYKSDRFVEKALPVGTVLTIPAAGSEGSPDSVVTHEDGMLKRAAHGEPLRPAFSILNPELTFTLPAYQTACGATDIMAHVFERYFTNTPEVEVSDRLCEALLLTMIKETPRVIEDPCNYEARANIIWAGTVAHNDICGVGHAQDWASHSIEHELSAQYDCAHGAGLAVIFPAWMKYVYKHDTDRFVRFAVNVWGCKKNGTDPEKTALEGIACVERFFRSIGMPTSFAEIGAKEEDIPKMAKKCFDEINGDTTIGNFVKLGEKEVADIYRLALNN
ncbi:MAG: iron-containing alcohol dehydrogenase [Clostridia bacterium]|nr:iron-containing alcohol dehydrogenase [Clostridia bacterium]